MAHFLYNFHFLHFLPEKKPNQSFISLQEKIFIAHFKDFFHDFLLALWVEVKNQVGEKVK